MDTDPAHIEPPPILCIKDISTSKSDRDYVILKLRRDPNYSASDPYELMMFLFDHSEPEEFLLFVQNFHMTLVASGMLEPEAKVQYICTLVCGEALCQFDFVSAHAKNKGTQLDVYYLLKGLA